MTFAYQPWVSSPYSASIGELLLHRGDIAAHAAETIAAANARAVEASGQAYGSAFQNIGQTIAAIPGDIQRQKTAALNAEHTRASTEDLKAQVAQRETAARTAQRVDQTKQQISALMADPSVFNEDGTLNVKSIVGKMSGPLPNGDAGPSQAPDVGTLYGIIDPINESLTKARQAKLAWEEHRTNAIARLANGVLQLGGPTPENPAGSYLEHAQVGIGALLKSGQITPEEAHGVLLPMIEHPEAVPLMLQHLVSQSTLPPIKLGEHDRLVNPLDPRRIVLDGAPERKPDYTINGRRFSGTDNRQIGEPVPSQAPGATKQGPVTPELAGQYQKQIDAILPATDKPNAQLRNLTLARVQNARTIEDAEKAIDEASRQVGQINVAKNTVPFKIEVGVGTQTAKDAAAAKGVSQEAIDQAAVKYAQTGEMSGLGMGNAVLRRQIMNRAAELYPSNSLAGNAAAFKANQASLTNITKTLDTLSAFENTAGKNLDMFLELAKSIPDTGVPWLNTPVRMLNEKLVGSENMAAVNAARDVGLREIARVTNDPKLSGALTDSARQEVAALSPRNATLPQIRKVVAVLRQDMANVHSGLTEQQADITGRLGSKSSQPAAPSMTAAGAPQAGERRMVNGQLAEWKTINGQSGWVAVR